LPDLVTAPADAAVFAGALRGLDRGLPDQNAALFGDPAAVHCGVGLVVFRGQPGPAGQLSRSGEAGDVADLGHEDRAQDRPDPGDRLHCLEARVAAEAFRGQFGEGVDLDIKRPAAAENDRRMQTEPL